MIKWRRGNERDDTESSHGKKLRGDEVTWRKETGRRETGGTKTGGKSTGRKATGAKETGERERRVVITNISKMHKPLERGEIVVTYQ